MDKIFTQLSNGLTRVEGLALLALLERIGLTAEEQPAHASGTRTWTHAQRTAHSRRMKAFWRARKRTSK
ncbi:MAG: hypothetical protein L0Z53_06725 [Acidobacteriales bacterium]|nr:hypothetical protein [Terriglobales bacterium]